MTQITIDGNKLTKNEEEHLKETFDLPTYNGDYEEIYQYLIGFYKKTTITLKNTNKIDPDLLETIEKASEYNQLVQIEKE